MYLTYNLSCSINSELIDTHEDTLLLPKFSRMLLLLLRGEGK